LVAPLVSGCALFSSNPAETADGARASASQTVPAPQENEAVKRMEKTIQGIDIAVQNVEREDAITAITLLMNNHVYNLEDFEVKNFSSLDGKAPKEYSVLSSGMGGHHITAKLIFPGDLYGKLVVGLSDSMLVDFFLQK